MNRKPHVIYTHKFISKFPDTLITKIIEPLGITEADILDITPVTSDRLKITGYEVNCGFFNKRLIPDHLTDKITQAIKNIVLPA